MALGTISTSGDVRELDQEGSWQSYAFMATVVSAAFFPVCLTVGAQVLEVYKQLSKRMVDYDDEEEEEEAAKAAKATDGGGDVTKFSNPLQADDDDDGGAEAVAAKAGDGNAMKSNPLQEDVGDATPVQASLGDAAPDKAAAVLSSE